jgi:hypothetical protein
MKKIGKNDSRDGSFPKLKTPGIGRGVLIAIRTSPTGGALATDFKGDLHGAASFRTANDWLLNCARDLPVPIKITPPIIVNLIVSILYLKCMERSLRPN